MGCTTPIRFIPSMVAPPASNRTVAKRSSATLEELTLNGDGVANATFITDRELSNSIALAAEVEIARHKYPYKTLDQPSAKKSHITYRKSQYSHLISHYSILKSHIAHRTSQQNQKATVALRWQERPLYYIISILKRYCCLVWYICCKILAPSVGLK